MDCALVNRVSIDAARRDLLDAISWCETQLGVDDDGKIWNVDAATGMGTRYTAVLDFCFARRDDAVRFMLTWA